MTSPLYAWMTAAGDFRGDEIDHLLISLLAIDSGQRDDLLRDSLDQAEPQLRGLEFEWTPYRDRTARALANCVAKCFDSPGHHRTRVVLEAAGVTDWEAFLREIVAPAKTYPVPMAMFSAHTDYRWVPIAELPTPHNPHRLPTELMKD